MSWKQGERVLIPGNDFLTGPRGFYWETPGGHTSSRHFARGQIPDASETQLCQVVGERPLLRAKDFYCADFLSVLSIESFYIFSNVFS